eukprot:Pgem_evm1s15050
MNRTYSCPCSKTTEGGCSTRAIFLAQGLTLQMIMPAIIMNICNVVVSYLFAFHTDFGLEG